MRFKKFFNEDLSMNSNNATQQNKTMSQPNTTNPNAPNQVTSFTDPAMQRIQKNLDAINKDAKSVTNVMNRNAIVNSANDFMTMLKKGANPQNVKNIANRNLNNTNNQANLQNRNNIPNQPNTNTQMGNAGNAAN